MKACTRSVALALIVSVPLVSGGCATSDEWTTWRAHRSHFASAVHMGFSVRNRAGSGPRVRRQDVMLAAPKDGGDGRSRSRRIRSSNVDDRAPALGIDPRRR
jgi:hypothetical protein